MKRNNSGFTMVELLVTVAVSSIVLAAAASLMLLGLRVHQTTQKEAGEQQTVRIVLSALEDLSASGKIYRVEPLSDGWQLQGKTADGTPGAVLLRYNSGTLTSGTSGDQVLLDNLRGARVDLDGSLVTFTFATAAHSYSTSVFCRTGIEGDSVGKVEAQEKLENPTLPTLPSTVEKDARFQFLQTLANQYDSRGEIKGGSGYFSEWYIGNYESHPAGTNTPLGAAASSRGQPISRKPPSTAIRQNSQTWTKAWRVSRKAASGATPMTKRISPSPATTSFSTGMAATTRTAARTPTTSARCCAWKGISFTPSRATAAARSPSTATRCRIPASWATAC